VARRTRWAPQRSAPRRASCRIAADEWAVDEALPTTVALAEHYRVSQSTITRVLRILAAEGLVRTVPRWGTFRTGADTLNG
jgi:DNA-binding GntR family transcriptional regulator